MKILGCRLLASPLTALLLSEFAVQIADEAFESEGTPYPPGSWVLSPAEGLGILNWNAFPGL